MTHPNEYPEKTFVPFEGDMPVQTTELSSVVGPNREGVSGIGAEERYYAELLMSESIEEAAALGPEPVFGSIAEAAAVQPDLIAMVEDDEIHIIRGEN